MGHVIRLDPDISIRYQAVNDTITRKNYQGRDVLSKL